MKNVQALRRIFGLVAVVALIGLVAVSCDSGAVATAAGTIYHTVSFHTDGSGVYDKSQATSEGFFLLARKFPYRLILSSCLAISLP